ncbi:hypothetical protein TWF481_012211 [Arthrobotrys musiformis]|uniref:Uncharacterized protein n=1 Tax=Arthrobotrys musiformis TaxID=47236 RepID=A0AAV9VWH5_9PEZI
MLLSHTMVGLILPITNAQLLTTKTNSTDVASALRKKVHRDAVANYLEYQLPYLRNIAPLINRIQSEAMNQFRVGWDEDIEEDYIRQMARRAAAAARREERRNQRAQQVDQEDEDDRPRPGMRFEDLMEQDERRDAGEVDDDDDDDDDDEEENNVPAIVGPSLTTLLENLQPVIGHLINRLNRINYNIVPYTPEAQRLEAGTPFNYRLLNEEARTQTVRALKKLVDLAHEGIEGWEIEINEHFAQDVDDYHERINGEIEPHGLLSMIEAMVLSINQSWVFGHDLRSIFAYIYGLTDYRPRRGRERDDGADYVLIDWNGAADYALNLEALVVGVAGFLAQFKADLNAAFKFLPKTLSGPFIPQALAIADDIIANLNFYHRLLTTFSRNVQGMADRPFGATTDQRHFQMIRGRERAQQEMNALDRLHQFNQGNQAAILNQFNEQNQGNPLNQGDFVEQMNELNRGGQLDGM